MAPFRKRCEFLRLQGQSFIQAPGEDSTDMNRPEPGVRAAPTASRLAGLLAAVLALVLPLSGAAREAPGGWALEDADSGAHKRLARPSATLAPRSDPAPAAVLAPAVVAEPKRVAALVDYNLSGKLPMRAGFERLLARPLDVAVSPGVLGRRLPAAHAGGVLHEAPGGRIAWTARLDIAEAYGVRVQLSDARLPDSARVWVQADGDLVRGPVGAGHRTPAGIWTPTAFGETVHLRVDAPRAVFEAGGDVAFRVERVGQIFQLDRAGALLPEPHAAGLKLHGSEDLPACFVDGQCRDSEDLSFIADYRHAVATLLFEVRGFWYVCNGALISGADGPGPFLLTANHCINTEASANSLEAYWDHYSDTCGSDTDPPDYSTRESSVGATLLATLSQSDTTLLEITGTLPAGRYHLGWTTDELMHGTPVYRLHNYAAHVQQYARELVDTGWSCGRLSTRYFFTEVVDGGVADKSSGSPTVIDESGGQIVGQLSGLCGPYLDDECDTVNNRPYNGALRPFYPLIHEFLDPANAETDVVTEPFNFSLAGGESYTHEFECGGTSYTQVFAFKFEGTATGLTGTQSDAFDLKLALSGPSGSSVTIGGYDDPGETGWTFGGGEEDGTYATSLGWLFDSGTGQTTTCHGTWTATFTNDWSSSDQVSWSDASIRLHSFSGCPYEDEVVLTGETVYDSQNFQACRTVTAGTAFAVGAGGDVQFRAGERVVLEPGFSVMAGGVFAAGIDDFLAP